jgi:hypothetical protein
MKRNLLVSLSVSLLGSCATVPPPQAEKSFSYTNILNQVECETLTAVEALKGDRYKWAKLDQWGVSVSISPAVTLDGQLGYGGSAKSRPGTHYFQWLAGGTSAASNGAGLELYGNNTAKNSYPFAIEDLFQIHKSADGKKIYDAAGNPGYILTKSGDRIPDPNLHCPLNPLPLKDGVPAGAFQKGFFGIKDFLVSSIPPEGAFPVLPTSIGYAKEYRQRVQLGVTAGWYVPLGNSSPAIGGYGMIDNTIGITFTPQIKQPAKANPVYIVENPNLKKPGTHHAGQPLEEFHQTPAVPRKQLPSVRGDKPLSYPLAPDTLDRLQNGANSLLQQQNIQQLGPDYRY